MNENLYTLQLIRTADNKKIEIPSCKGIYFYQFDEGLGLPEIERLSIRGTFQNGDTDLGFRLLPRTVTFGFSFHGNENDYFNLKNNLMDVIKPSSDPFKIRIVRYNDVKILYGHYIGGMTINSEDIKELENGEFYQAVSMNIKCNDPVFTGEEQFSHDFSIVSASSLIFPFTFPMTIGESSLVSNADIVYNGTWVSYPSITITGPIDAPKIVNNTTGEKIELSYNVSAGEEVFINLDYGNKTIKTDLNVSIIGTLSGDSDLETFHLSPAPDASGGVNSFTVTGTNLAAGVSKVSFQWYDRFEYYRGIS